eukprot:TRINITY_DN33274_c0_g1_i1.p1 TRINITY_DN33274_c0_g1~~TRINITY_DN33274_c0_g1_i1.p1  ORF type:complete len:135 (+),score=4.81 TRINITY_DN33274_c0_g1_i1:52-405(+)
MSEEDNHYSNLSEGAGDVHSSALNESAEAEEGADLEGQDAPPDNYPSSIASAISAVMPFSGTASESSPNPLSCKGASPEPSAPSLCVSCACSSPSPFAPGCCRPNAPASSMCPALAS